MSVEHTVLLPSLGSWQPSADEPFFDEQSIAQHVQRVRQPLYIVQDQNTGHVGVTHEGTVSGSDTGVGVVGILPPLYPEWLGSRAFCEAHRVRFAYVAGAMANGIATADMVIAMAESGMLAFFGAAGLSFHTVERELRRLCDTLGTGDEDVAWGANLINSPQEPQLERRVAELYVKQGVRRVSASAYMKLSEPIVHYAYHGVHEDEQGNIVRPNHVFAKISRTETATHFLSPAPKAMIDALVERGALTSEEGRLAALLPVAEDIIVESDSGGHTDNRPMTALLPDIQQLARQCAQRFSYTRPVRVGVAGGIGTPTAAAAAFATGADFILTGSINQSAVESGLSMQGREMLALAGLADVIMAPAADMFELGVEVQVLKRGTMFGPRAKKLHELYHTYPSLDAIPAVERERLEKRVLGAKIEDIWSETLAFWTKRDPEEAQRARNDPRRQMALVFRWYLGKASKWAIDGEPGRALDYQIWCGPAMGSFNTWVKGSFLEEPSQRKVVQLALNVLEGAAQITRAHQARSYGLQVPPEAFDYRPRPLSV